MGDPSGFLKNTVARTSGAPARRPAPDRLERGLRGVLEGHSADPGQPVHGLRYSVLPQRLPAREPDSRVERPGVQGPLARQHRSSARDQQLPGVHRSAVPRTRARRRVSWASTRIRSPSSRSRSRSSTRPSKRAGSSRFTRRTLTGKTVAVVGSGPAGLAAAQQLTRAGHTVTVFERADRIGGLLRYGIPEFKMEKRHIDRRLEQMEAEGTVFKTSVDVGVDITADELREQFDAVVLAGGATALAICPSRAANSTASTRRWSSCRSPTACSWVTSRSAPSPPRARRSSSSAAATPVRTASAPRTVRARAASTSSRSCRVRPETRAESHPVADVPAHVPGGFGTRGRRRASLLRQHRELRR